MSVKVIGGAMGGVAIPIVIEYAMKGADISPSIPLKWSGVAGVAVGAIDLALVYTKVGPFKFMSAENKDALVAFGASSLATGIAILVLEQLRNSAGYTFQPPAGWQAPMVPIIAGMQSQMAQQYTSPVGQVIQEI
jgi:hypothetical protein